jgi:hopanoid biosynthesis associated protein HpnK
VKRLIVNADDFGLSESVNCGILRAHVHGIVTSATLMATMPGFDHAVGLAKSHPSLGIGVHLNVLRGSPLSPPEAIPSLVGRNGTFLNSFRRFAGRLVTGRIRAEDIQREFAAQVDRVREAGITVSHVDSEKHLHALPILFRAAATIAEAAGVRGIRVPSETKALVDSSSATAVSRAGRLKAAIVRHYAEKSRRQLRERSLRTTDSFFGVAVQGIVEADVLVKLARKLRHGVCEITCHPGFVDDELVALSAIVGGYWVNNVREKELGVLTDSRVKEALEANNVELVNFHDL